MTFATKMLPGPTSNPVEDGLERPAPGPEPTPSREQGAGKEGNSVPPPPEWQRGGQRDLKMAGWRCRQLVGAHLEHSSRFLRLLQKALTQPQKPAQVLLQSLPWHRSRAPASPRKAPSSRPRQPHLQSHGLVPKLKNWLLYPPCLKRKREPWASPALQSQPQLTLATL